VKWLPAEAAHWDSKFGGGEKWWFKRAAAKSLSVGVRSEDYTRCTTAGPVRGSGSGSGSGGGEEMR